MNAATKQRNEVATIEHSNALTPPELLERAIITGAAPEIIGKMMDVQERWERGQNRKAFGEAMAAAQAEMPAITKDKTVDFTSQKGRTTYKHATLGHIEKTVKPVLAKHGLHYRYNTKCEPDRMTVTCIVERAGHFEENTLSAPLDTSGNKNPIQAIGSTQTYLQRYTLMAALGLSASEDDDANAVSAEEFVTAEQVAKLEKAIKETGGDVAKFCAYAKVESLAQIYASRYDAAMKAIEDAGAARKAKGK